MNPPIHASLERGGGLLVLRLARPKANIVDGAMVGALSAALREHRGRAGVRAALLTAEGPHTSFGASVEEHLPARCAEMLASLHRLVVDLLEWPAPVLAAIRGQCLGGGLELALACAVRFASEDARLGQPEIKLGVFAPAASCLLPAIVGQGLAEDMLLSGRSLTAAEALAAGLVQRVEPDGEVAALAYFDRHLAGSSGASLARALAAVRSPWAAEVRRRLAEVERLYLDDLMKTHDANEGLAAFLDKREPRWEHR